MVTEPGRIGGILPNMVLIDQLLVMLITYLPIRIRIINPGEYNIDWKVNFNLTFHCKIMSHKNIFFILCTSDLISNDGVFFIQMISNKNSWVFEKFFQFSHLVSILT
ncbi:hypothetical protein D3C77_388980 [compost metagenome]